MWIVKKPSVKTGTQPTDLPAPTVIPADQLDEYIITAGEIARVAGGKIDGGGTTTGVVSPPERLSRAE